MTDRPALDPTRDSLWRPLRLLQAAMDADIARLYAERRIEGLKPSYVMELLRLRARGPMTIRELAESVERTHSALSQKVAAMRAAGWVETVTGDDARTKKVTLTDRARRVVDRLAAEWRATEAALADLEAEIPYPLSRVVTDIERALAHKSFHDRIAEKLAEDPAWAEEPDRGEGPGRGEVPGRGERPDRGEGPAGTRGPACG
jgi:DNA-binding MarR family transcriptional regulator